MDPTDETPYRPTVRTQTDLEEVWRHLMGPWGFGGRSTWMLLIDEASRVFPHITEITDCDQPPDPGLVDGLADLLRNLEDFAPGGSFAFLISRPGRGLHDSDRMWARFLQQAGEAAGVRLEMTHLATDAGVVPLPPDELTLRSA